MVKNVIKERRAELGLSLADVAAVVGVHRATVQRWESGEIENLGHEKIASLAAALQVSPEYLLGWTDDPTTKKAEAIQTAIMGLTEEETREVLNYIAFLKAQRKK